MKESDSNFLINKLRVELATAYRFAYRYGFSEGICNHFSTALPIKNHYFLPPYGVHWSIIEPHNFLVVDINGTKISGKGFIEPTAFNIHSEIHKLRPEVKCIMHTHMPHALVLATIKNFNFEMSDQNACRFYNRIAYYRDYNGLVLKNIDAEDIAIALKDKDIIFMASHGVIVVGNTIAEAWDDLYYLERACKVQVLAYQTRKDINIISNEIAFKVSEQIKKEKNSLANNAHRHLESLRQILVKEGNKNFILNDYD